MKKNNNTQREFSKHQASKKGYKNHVVNPSAKPSRGLSTKAADRKIEAEYKNNFQFTGRDNWTQKIISLNF
mgnify:CR=1 FL=1